MVKIKLALVLTALLTGCASEPPGLETESDIDVRDDAAPELLAQNTRPDDWYYIKARHSQKCLHQYGATTGNGDPINQWDCVAQPNVQWRIMPAPHAGYYYVQARHSGKCLHQYGATTGNGDPINQWDCVDQPNVQWRIVPASQPGYYYFQARHSGKCLHQYGATHGNGDPINQWDCVDQANVQWSLEPVPKQNVPDQPPVEPGPPAPPAGGSLQSVTTQGAGCPAGSVTTSTDNGWEVLALPEQRVSLDRTRSSDRRDCALTLRVRVPQGQTVSVERVTYAGWLTLDEGVELRQEVRHTVTGAPVAVPPRTLSTRGPKDTFYTLIQSFDRPDSQVWWPCGVDRDVTLNVTDVIRRVTGQGGGFTNSARAPQVRVKLVRARC